MQCPSCGTALGSGDAFCPTCGAEVRGVTAQVAPTQQMPAVAAPPPPPPSAAYPAPPAPPAANPTTSFPQAAGQQPPAKKGLSSAAVIGIVIGILVGVLALGAVGVFAARSIWAGKAKTAVVSTPTTPETKIVAPKTEVPDAQAPVTTPDAKDETPAEPGIVTDAEARDIVGRFITLRIKGDIAGSKELCSKNMLSGENGDFVNDKYWRPDSFEITKTTPDLMYIHVTTQGMWPSGREPTIYSVWRDPNSGQVVIDGMLDPETVPELVNP